jgi:hypothetical protein
MRLRTVRRCGRHLLPCDTRAPPVTSGRDGTGWRSGSSVMTDNEPKRPTKTMVMSPVTRTLKMLKNRQRRRRRRKLSSEIKRGMVGINPYATRRGGPRGPARADFLFYRSLVKIENARQLKDLAGAKIAPKCPRSRSNYVLPLARCSGFHDAIRSASCGFRHIQSASVRLAILPAR